MCTVTIVPAGRGFRLACNRDESIARPAAAPPRLLRFGARVALLPIDPVSGGTWIAANDAGLVLALLNSNPLLDAAAPVAAPAARPPERLSRGLIIPSLLDCATLEQAFQRAFERIDPWRHAAFRLVVTDGRRIADLVSDCRRLRSRRARLGRRPWMFTSSGLGDLLVLGPRTRLFEACFHAPGDPARAQDLFHRHSWPTRSHLSVCMRRPDARTVSHTVIDVNEGRIVVDYVAGAPDIETPGARTRLEARLPAQPARAAC